MTSNVLKLLPDEELQILDAYIKRSNSIRLNKIPDQLGIPENPDIPRVSIAVAQILLEPIQELLPSWSCIDEDHEFIASRKVFKRFVESRLKFNPHLIFLINWADSGPGFSWPEAYYITYLPGFNKYIVTASRDSEDLCGCTDNAIGFFDGDLDKIEVAKKALIKHWRVAKRQGLDDGWQSVWERGLVNHKVAISWAKEVWR